MAISCDSNALCSRGATIFEAKKKEQHLAAPF